MSRMSVWDFRLKSSGESGCRGGGGEAPRPTPGNAVQNVSATRVISDISKLGLFYDRSASPEVPGSVV